MLSKINKDTEKIVTTPKDIKTQADRNHGMVHLFSRITQAADGKQRKMRHVHRHNRDMGSRRATGIVVGIRFETPRSLRVFHPVAGRMHPRCRIGRRVPQKKVDAAAGGRKMKRGGGTAE